MILAHHAVFEHELQADLAVDQLLANTQQGGIRHDVGGRIHQLFAFQAFQLVHAGLAHQHLHAGGAAFVFQHIQARGLHANAHLPPADEGNTPFLADALEFGLRLLYPFLLLADFVGHRIDRPLDFPAFRVQPPVAVDIGDLIGDFGRPFGIFRGHADVHQRRVAILLHPQTARKNPQRQFRHDGRFVLVKLRAPDPLQVQIADHLHEDRARSHDLLLGHQEKGVVADAGRLAVVERIHVHGILAHLQLGGGGVLVRHHQGIGGPRHDGQQGHRQDNLLAVAHHAPVVKEV